MFLDRISRFLAKNVGEWFTIKEIAKNLKLSVGYVSGKSSKLKDKANFYFRPKGKGKEFMYKK